MLFDQISNDIKDAMKAKDKVRLETLRNIKKYFLEAKTAPGANDTLTDENALKILQKLAKQGKESASLYVSQNRQDLADDELAQVAVIETYLPKKMSETELGVLLGGSRSNPFQTVSLLILLCYFYMAQAAPVWCLFS